MKDKLLQVGIDTYKKAARYHTFLPRQVKVEVTRACNLHCIGCRRNFPGSIANAPGPQHLTFDMLKDIIKDLPIKVVRFTGDGEPLCNPTFHKILAYLYTKGVRTAITTNATLLNESWIRFLEQNKVLRVSVSFDGAKKETFEKLRGGADFNQVLEVCRLLGKSKIQLYMNCLLSTDEVIEQLPNYVELAKEVGATGIHLMKYQSQEENVWAPPDWSKHQGLLEGITKEAKKRGLLISAPYYGEPTFRECEDPYMAPWISLAGDVYPCVYMANMREYEVYLGEKIPVPSGYYIMGNIKDTPLREIWYNRTYWELRDVLNTTRKTFTGKVISPKLLLKGKKIMEGKERFGYCHFCPCRWGESGI